MLAANRFGRSMLTHMLENKVQNVIAHVLETSHTRLLVISIPRVSFPFFYTDTDANEQQGIGDEEGAMPRRYPHLAQTPARNIEAHHREARRPPRPPTLTRCSHSAEPQ
jgi:hypothetical protein